jgi:hypothetical protein
MSEAANEDFRCLFIVNMKKEGTNRIQKKLTEFTKKLFQNLKFLHYPHLKSGE